MSAILLSFLLAATLAGDGKVTSPGLQFVENRGQWAEHVELAALWTAGEQRGALRAERGRVVLQVDDIESSSLEVIAYTIEGGADWRPEGRVETSRHHAFLGNDPSQWVRNAVAFERVVYVDGEGAERLEVLWSGGSVQFRATEAPVRLLLDGENPSVAPTAIEISGTTPFEAQFGVAWATYFAGFFGHWLYFADARLSPDGKRLVIAGKTTAPRFPTTPGVYSSGPPSENFGDLILVSFAADTGKLLWSTAIGGSNGEGIPSLAVGPDGRVVFGVHCKSTDFPVTGGALYPNPAGASAFGALSEDGSQLLFSSYFLGFRVVVAARSDGSVVVGTTTSANAPATPGTFGASHHGQADAFVAVLAPDGSSVLWGTYLGASGSDELKALAVLADDAIAVTGRAGNWSFPKTPGAYAFGQPPGSNPTAIATFVTVIEPDGAALRWSSLIGGSGPGQNPTPPEPRNIAVGHDGRIAISGVVKGSQLPPGLGGAQPTYSGFPQDGFVFLLAPDGSAALGATYIGSPYEDSVGGLSFDRSGVVWITGQVSSGTPVTTADSVRDQLHLARLTPNLARYLHSQRMAGRNSNGVGIFPMPRGRAAIAGSVTTGNLPTTPGAAYPSFLNAQTGVAMLHSMLPKGVAAVGRSGPPCDSDSYLAVVGPAAAGAPEFTFYASQLPGGAAGWLLVGQPAEATSLMPEGPDLVVNLATDFALVPFQADAAGYAYFETGLPGALAGAELAAQAVFLAPDTCGALGLVWTHGLLIQVAP